MTDKKWWTDSFPSQYYAYATDKTLGGYPVAGLANLDIYSKQPDWLTSSTTVVALTQAQYLSINPVNLIIKDGVLSNYVAPATTDTGTSGTSSAATSSTATETTTTSTSTDTTTATTSSESTS